MKKSFLCLAAVFAVLFGVFVASCSSSADSPNLALFTQSSGGGSSDSGGGTQTTPTPTPTPPAEWNVTYVITNGSDDMTSESRTSGKYTAQSELAIPQKEGFQFKGWYSDQEQTQAVASFAGLTGDVTLYGHWAGTLYTVVIEGIDGATLAEGSAAVAGFSTEDTTLSLPAYTKRFYDFAGLYLDSEFNGTAVTQIDKDSAESGATLTLHAKWTEKVYTVNYDLLFESGVTNPNTNIIVTLSSAPQALSDPICADSNYKFAGWFADYSGGTYSNQVTEVSVDGVAGDDDSITLHAKWTHATPWTPSGATVLVTTMQTVANDIAALTVEGEEFYLLVTDTSITGTQFRPVNAALKANATTYFYFDFSAAMTAFSLENADGTSTYSFNGCTNLTGIVFPECLLFTTIERAAFENCAKLKVIKLPDQLTKICAFSFKNCVELETVYLPKNLLTVEIFVFENCSKLKVYYKSTYEDFKKVNFRSMPNQYGGALYALEQGTWERVYTITYWNGSWVYGYKYQEFFVENEDVLLPATENVYKAGYDFCGWYDNGRYTGNAFKVIPSGTNNDVSYYAKWIARNDTPYKVLHYQENPNDSDYTLYETEIFAGTTNSYVAPTSKDYLGFMAEPVSRQYINGNGETEMKIYYKRKTATLTIDLAGGILDGKTGTITKSGKYGASVPIFPNPQKANYTFMGWDTNGGTLPSIFTEDATYTAVWVLNEVHGIDITIDPLSDISVTKSQSGNTVTFTAEECDLYSWMLDGAAKGSARTCSINTSTLLKGTYTLTLEAKKGGKWFSYTTQIKVN